jgi:hypothetical protein
MSENREPIAPEIRDAIDKLTTELKLTRVAFSAMHTTIEEMIDRDTLRVLTWLHDSETRDELMEGGTMFVSTIWLVISLGLALHGHFLTAGLFALPWFVHRKWEIRHG